MKLKIILVVLCVIFISSYLIAAGGSEDFLKTVQKPSESSLDEGTVISGLKEVLSIGTASAVKSVARENGYSGNKAIMIPLPGHVQKIGKVLRKAGMKKEVDDFILSMNRAAEKAAPMATPIFINAIKRMSFQDATKILNGGDTAATDYFRTKTSSYLAEIFKPEISSSMNKVGVTRQYKVLTEKYLSLIPFAKKDSYDLDQYVTNKALNGLFYMVSQEEKKIRTNPAARTTDILKNVFGKK
jgi:hypothetical protein